MNLYMLSLLLATLARFCKCCTFLNSIDGKLYSLVTKKRHALQRILIWKKNHKSMQSHVISEKTKSHLVVHEALVVVSWEKSSEVSAMFVNLARNALYIYIFCGFKVLLPVSITCYYYLTVGLKEAA